MCVVFAFEVEVTTFRHYYLPLGERYLLSSLVDVLRLFQAFCWVHLLHASYGRILKLVCLLWILQYPWSSAGSRLCIFSNMVLELKHVVPCSTFWVAFLHILSSCLPKPALPAAIRSTQRTKRWVCEMWVRHAECLEVPMTSRGHP